MGDHKRAYYGLDKPSLGSQIARGAKYALAVAGTVLVLYANENGPAREVPNMYYYNNTISTYDATGFLEFDRSPSKNKDDGDRLELIVEGSSKGLEKGHKYNLTLKDRRWFGLPGSKERLVSWEESSSN